MLLTTKFLRPTADARAIPRDRLLALLQARPPKRLNLIVSPAGFGKTTLASQWCARAGMPVAWLSLDENDNDPRRFWQYVVGAFEYSGLEGVQESKKQLNHCASHEIEGPITGLINTLAAQPSDWGLVLDDYHLAGNTDIQRQLTYFIDYLPPGITVTLVSRTEPDLPFARWRVRQWVDDVHPQLLAFSQDECLRFFRDYMSLQITDTEARDIWRKTEGWVAAMQLSALSGRQVRDSVTTSTTPLELDERRINDYVLSEVLQQQPDNIRRFLLDTACCPRLCASLCNGIREASDSQAMLEHLLRNNLFLIPLDTCDTRDTRDEWFRYHDLFREALLQRAYQLDPERASRNHSAAIRWLLEHNHVQEGISQIVQRRDWPWLARVLEQHGNNLIHGGFHLPVLDWLDELPAEMVHDSPQLMMLRVWALFFANRVDVIDPLLTELEDLLDQRVADSHPDAEGALGLNSEISLIRSYLARSKSDEKSASDLTRQVLQDIDHTRIPLKSVTYYGLGLDYFGKGDLPGAEDALRSAVQYGQLERKPSTVLSSGGLLAWIQYNRGDIDHALDTCTEIRQWVDQHYADPRQPRLISCWQNSSLIEIYRERNEPQLAHSYLAPLLEHVKSGTEPGQHVIIQYVRGHLAFSEGHYNEAIDYLLDADTVARRRRDHILFEPPSCSALLARCYLATDNYEPARQWLDSLQPDQFTNPLNREQCLISAARVEVALGRPEQAMARLAPLRLNAEQDQHNRHLIEILMVYAEALIAESKHTEAEQLLNQALKRAADAGFLRIFAEESDTLRQTISQLPAVRLPGSWNSRLLGMLRQQTDTLNKQPRPSMSPPPSHTRELAEPLSLREQEVLSLIHQGLANKDIAARMSVAATTVKAHIRNLYGKLGVGSRTEALARARELGLLE